jgi:anaerobic selenocysteine-containing dehydrogenase
METRTTYNCCPGVGCHAGCIHTTHVRDGKIIKVEPTLYPDGDKGVICVKGYTGARLPYHPDRLKHPLKRVGKRGEGKWERITWEQALDEIADKIKDIRKEFPPESILFSPHYNSVPYHSTQMLLGHRLKNLLQATGFSFGHSVDSNPQFSGYFTYGLCPAHFMDPKVLVEGNTRYMIVWGCDPAIKSNRLWKSIRQAKQNGAKLVDIGLLRDETARASDEFIQVNAGSDGALALAMVHEIIEKKLHQQDYIRKYTNGTFLVCLNTGKLLRESDISPDGAVENYVVWVPEKGGPLTVCPHVGLAEGVEPAISGVFNINGIECKPVFELVTELAQKHAPEKVTEITGVAPDTIKKLAVEYATTKPAAIILTFGLRYENSGNAIRAMDLLGAITGNIGIKGGGTVLGAITLGLANAPLLSLNDPPILYATEAREKVLPIAQIYECLVTGKPYPIKAMLTYGFNYLNTQPNPKRWIEHIFPNLDLIVVNEIFMTATAEYADYVLPDATLFEREDMDIGQNGFIMLNEKAIEPMYDCRPPVYYWTELAKRLGFGEHFDKDMDEWNAFRLESGDPSIAGIDPPLTLDLLKREKIVRANLPVDSFYAWFEKQFFTPSGRLEIYNEELLPGGDALPVYREQMESPRSSLAEKYPLVFNTANPKYFIHTMFPNDEKMLEKYMKEPHVFIHPRDAETRDIFDEDVVAVFNDRGICKTKVKISDLVPPGVVNLPYGWWPKQFIEGHPQNLISSNASLETPDKSREIQWAETLKKFDPHTEFVQFAMSFSADKLFDCLCEVKKTS